MNALLIPTLCAALSCGVSENTEFRYVQLADTQLGFNVNEYADTSDRQYAYETERFESVVAQINHLSPAPDFVVICGDMINAYKNEYQYFEFFRIAAKLNSGIQIKYVSGNHEVGNTPTSESLERYRDNFGDDVYAFNHKGLLGLGLNSSLINKPENVPEEYESQLQFVKSVLEINRYIKHSGVVVFQHHPFFLNYDDEPDNYSNIALKNRQEYLNVLTEYKIDMVMTGHLHAGKAIGVHDGVEYVSVAAVSGAVPRMNVVDVSSNGITYEEISIPWSN